MALESLVTFAAEGILTKVATRVAQGLGLALGFKDELTKLSKSLPLIQDLLADAAEQPEDRSKSIEEWVKELTVVAQDADDVLDELEYEDTRRKVELRHQVGKKVLNLLTKTNPAVFHLKMAHKIKSINASLMELEKRSSTVGLVAQRGVARIEVSQRRGDRDTDSFFERDEKIIGRENVVSDIVTTLIKPNAGESFSVMAIVGMAGLGKTTVAKSVYNKDEINCYFDKKIWVCVSDPFDVNAILSRILESLNSTKAGIIGRDALIKNLQEELRGKKCLLILDDVWNEETQKWSNLRDNCLLKLTSAACISIVVTTRSARVASITETLPRCDLANLSDDECWSILKNRAFPGGSGFIAPDLEEIGREIARKCGGLPLAAKLLGGVMRNQSKDVWLSIQQSRTWDSLEEEQRIMWILKLSFDNLKLSTLKQCFAYCSLFEKDSEMEKDDLIQLWMAQGWLHSSSSQSSQVMEEIGEEYFNILAENSLFQDIRRNYDGNITCKMHDLVHDLAERVSKSKILAWNSNKMEDKTESAREVADVHVSMLPKIRSLFPNHGEIDFPDDIFAEKFKALRVLKLQNTNIETLPISVGVLKHLRYLDVSYTRMTSLPKSIAKLYNLQTLRIDVRGVWGVRGPIEFEFPKKFKNLINLRHLCVVPMYDASKIGPIGGIGLLANLQTLSAFTVGYNAGEGIEELAGLNQLRGALHVFHLERVRNGEEVKKANLVGKKNMRKLTFEWEKNRAPTSNNNDGDVLESLQPCPELEYLQINNFMGAMLPSWISALEHLKEIRLFRCEECERVPTLGCLQHLTFLDIEGMRNLKCIGAELYCCDAVATTSMETKALFPVLETLSIRDCPNLLEWVTPTEKFVAFPCLEKLILLLCPRLKTVPYHYPSLRKLRIVSCAELTSVQVSSSSTLLDLVINNCRNLETIPNLENFTSLNCLSIGGCERLTSLPSGIPSCTSLKSLDIRLIPQLESIPSLENLTSLSELRISGCEELKHLPAGLDCLTCLKELKIGGFWKELDFFPDFPVLSQLERLTLVGWPKLNSLPQQVQHFTSLTYLAVDSFDGMEALPDWLGNLTSLKYLIISRCSNLMYLPSDEAMQRLTKLENLNVYLCPRLEERCTKESGPEWPKISHLKLHVVGV